MHGSVEQARQGSLSSQLDITIPSAFSHENRVTLYHGDCMEFLQTIPDGSVQLVVTSPPYNIGKKYEDVLDIEVYKAQQREVIEECVRVLKPEGNICWEVGNYVIIWSLAKIHYCQVLGHILWCEALAEHNIEPLA